MENQDINKGRTLVEFARVFEVTPSPGNVGQLLLRKDTSRWKDQDNVLTVNASCFFACGLVYGAQIVCQDTAMQNDLFHSFTQEDADAIARKNLQDVTIYLEQIRDGVKEIKVEPRLAEIEAKREDFIGKVKTAMKAGRLKE